MNYNVIYCGYMSMYPKILEHPVPDHASLLFYLKHAGNVTNSVYPDQTPQNAASDWIYNVCIGLSVPVE